VIRCEIRPPGCAVHTDVAVVVPASNALRLLSFPITTNRPSPITSGCRVITGSRSAVPVGSRRCNGSMRGFQLATAPGVTASVSIAPSHRPAAGACPVTDTSTGV